MVTALGVNTNSTAPQSDYYVVNVAALKLEKAASAFEAVWLPGLDQLMYTTPRDTAPLGGTAKERDVWVQHLKLFDPATETAAITTGVTRAALTRRGAAGEGRRLLAPFLFARRGLRQLVAAVVVGVGGVAFGPGPFCFVARQPQLRHEVRGT